MKLEQCASCEFPYTESNFTDIYCPENKHRICISCVNRDCDQCSLCERDSLYSQTMSCIVSRNVYRTVFITGNCVNSKLLSYVFDDIKQRRVIVAVCMRDLIYQRVKSETMKYTIPLISLEETAVNEWITNEKPSDVYIFPNIRYKRMKKFRDMLSLCRSLSIQVSLFE